jgi:hypothetical protein
MIEYNFSKYYNHNNKFTIVVKKDKPSPPNLLVQPKMIFTKASYKTNYEETSALLKKLRDVKE